MTTSSATVPSRVAAGATHELAPWVVARLADLRRAFAVDFTLVDVDRCEIVHASGDQPSRPWLDAADLYGEVARRQQPEFVADEEPLLQLAVPLDSADQSALVATALFLLRPIAELEDCVASAARLGIEPKVFDRWARTQQCWNANALEQMAQLLLEKWSGEKRSENLVTEVEQITSHLLATYEEISLLHRLTQNLKISRSETQLGRLALEWLADVLPVEGLAILLQQPGEASGTPEVRRGMSLLTYGSCPIADEEDADRLVNHFGPQTLREPVVLNRPARHRADWPFPSVRGLIVVPLSEGEKIFGWLAAFNHSEGDDFGTVESSLLGSVGAILGIHSGNIDLYRQQAEFLASVVRALTSAIDAKDPYTCGHSDRVARVAVRLAQELGCDEHTLDTIYLSGLLHDIGKIGIDDNVLRKPGKLTAEEFEHIKLHPELGYKILRDLKQLDQVLPVVLHHHEAWNGKGYPHGLAGEQIPLLARIVAVADSFDAMSSDRPYRKGMPLDKLEEILRDGAGQQWDAQVVDVFMKVREDIYEIARHEREALKLNLHQWS